MGVADVFPAEAAALHVTHDGVAHQSVLDASLGA
jgi:hypothetical protein